MPVYDLVLKIYKIKISTTETRKCYTMYIVYLSNHTLKNADGFYLENIRNYVQIVSYKYILHFIIDIKMNM